MLSECEQIRANADSVNSAVISLAKCIFVLNGALAVMCCFGLPVETMVISLEQTVAHLILISKFCSLAKNRSFLILLRPSHFHDLQK